MPRVGRFLFIFWLAHSLLIQLCEFFHSYHLPLCLRKTHPQTHPKCTLSVSVSIPAPQVDAYHNEHATALKAVERELDTIKESMFRQSQELFKLRKEEASLVADISGTQSTARNLQGKIHDLDQRSLKQQEMLYNIEFQVILEILIGTCHDRNSHLFR
jgi:hypothetical protein